MNAIRNIACAVALGLACSAAHAQAAERNGVLAANDGRTLYTFDGDVAGKSTCNGGCATAWPPFAANADAIAAGRFTLVARYDGSKQWAIDGKPLYFFSGDAKAGETKGDGHSGMWHIVRPSTRPARAASPALRAIDPYTTYFRQVFNRSDRSSNTRN